MKLFQLEWQQNYAANCGSNSSNYFLQPTLFIHMQKERDGGVGGGADRTGGVPQ